MGEPATPQFTHEEGIGLRQLVQSYGWRLLMEKVFVPRIQQVTEMLDRPNVEQHGHGDLLRGHKRAYLQLIDLVYHAAGQQNPIAEATLGLMRRMNIGEPPEAMKDQLIGNAHEAISSQQRPGHTQGVPI